MRYAGFIGGGNEKKKILYGAGIYAEYEEYLTLF